MLKTIICESITIRRKQMNMEISNEKPSTIVNVAVEKSTLRVKKRRFEKMDSEFHDDSFVNTPSSNEELVSRLGRNWRQNLSRLGSLVEVFKHVTANYLKDTTKNPTILPISTRNRILVEIFGSYMNISNTIRLARRAGLVQCTLEKFRFNCAYNQSRRYAWNKKVEKMVLSLVKEHGIEVKVLEKESHHDFVNEYKEILNRNEDKIRVSSKLRFVKTEPNYANAILANKYRDLFEEAKAQSNEMNNDLSPEQRMKYDWNLHYSKKGYLTKVGMRGTNMICSLKAHENEHANYNGLWRRDYLNEQFGCGNWFEYDVKGSIFKVAHLLSYGEWLGNDVDPYETMFGKFDSDLERNAMKSMTMCLYFDNKNQIFNHNRRFIPNSIKEYGEEKIQKAIFDAVDDMEKFTGKSIDSEIFFHETNIYIDFVYQLRKKLGLTVVQVYDGFYMTKGSIDTKTLDEIMMKSAMKYYKKFVAWKDKMKNT